MSLFELTPIVFRLVFAESEDAIAAVLISDLPSFEDLKGETHSATRTWVLCEVPLDVLAHAPGAILAMQELARGLADGVVAQVRADFDKLGVTMTGNLMQ